MHERTLYWWTLIISHCCPKHGLIGYVVSNFSLFLLEFKKLSDVWNKAKLTLLCVAGWHKMSEFSWNLTQSWVCTLVWTRFKCELYLLLTASNIRSLLRIATVSRAMALLMKPPDVLNGTPLRWHPTIAWRLKPEFCAVHASQQTHTASSVSLHDWFDASVCRWSSTMASGFPRFPWRADTKRFKMEPLACGSSFHKLLSRMPV